MLKILKIAIVIVIISGFGIKAENIENLLPSIAGVNNFGTEFSLTVLPAFEDLNPPQDNTIKLFILALADTEVEISVTGKVFNVKRSIKAGRIEDIAIAPEVGAAFRKNPYDAEIPGTIFKSSAIEIKSNAPIAVYVLLSYRQNSEGYLALPNSALGTSYQVATYTESAGIYGIYNNFPAMTAIIANENNTDVYFKMGGNQSSRTSDNLVKGELAVRTLHKGDIWVISSKGAGADLSGSTIESNNPIGVISANYAANVPTSNKWSNYTSEMHSPINTWGKHYITASVANRKFAPVFRIFAKNNNAQIKYNNEDIGVIVNDLSQEDLPFLEYRPEPSSKIHHFSSDSPISVLLFNSGTEEDGLPLADGSPFMMQLNSVEQSVKTIYFSFPLGNSFSANYANIIFETDELGKIPDDLMLGSVRNGVIDYLPFSDFNILDINYLASEIDGKYYGSATLRLANNISYVVKSSLGVNAYLYGVSESVSYGFPAFQKLSDIASGDFSPPITSWEFECNGSISGTTTDMPDDVTTRSNLSFALFDITKSRNYIFYPEQIKSGITRSINWEMRIIDPMAEARAVVYFFDKAGNGDTLDISYMPPQIEIIPAYHNFGVFKAGNFEENEIKDFTLINRSEQAFNVTELVLKNIASSHFEIIAKDLPVVLNQDEEYHFQVGFTPTVSGRFTDSVGVNNECLKMFRSFVEATVSSPIIYVNDINFGEITLGQSKTEPLYISNTGKVELLINQVIPPKQAIFDLELFPMPDRDNPLRLAPDSTAVLYVTFTPTQEGVYMDSIVFISDANTIKNVSYLNATGSKPGLIAQSYNWERRTIHRTEFPAGPYQSGGILLTNSSTEPLTILDVEEINISGSRQAFEYNHLELINQAIKPGDNIRFPISFRPGTVGQHQIVLKYKDSQNGSASSTFEGIGVAPLSELSDIDFGELMINALPKSKYITIRNQDFIENKFADTLIIYDLKPAVPLSISENMHNWGSAGFRFDKSLYDFPLYLAPGEELDIYLEFAPQFPGNSLARLIPMSNALIADTINITGFGSQSRIDFIGGEMTTCVGKPETIVAKIENKGIAAINVLSLGFAEHFSEFSFANPEDAKGFTLEPMQGKNVAINFFSVNPIDKTAEIIAEIEGIETTYISAKVRIVSEVCSIIMNISPEYQTFEVGTRAESRAVLLEEVNPKYDITNLKITLDYDYQIISPILQSIQLSENNIGKFVIQNVKKNNSKQTEFSIKSMTHESLRGPGLVYSLEFNTYLPQDTSNFSLLRTTITSVSSPYLKIITNDSEFRVGPVCADQLRRVNISGYEYNFDDIYPNPASNKVVMNFSLGLKANTRIEVYNSIGYRIAEPINEILDAGAYTLDLDTQYLSNGVYFIRIISGEYEEVKQINISK